MTAQELRPLDERLLPIRQRLARARELAEALRGVESAYLQGSTGHYVEERNGHWAVRARMDGRPPARAALIMGELVHQCRSALDNLVVVLADEGAHRELSDEEAAAHQFPIEYDVTKFNSQVARRLAHVPRVFVDRIREVQPFNGLPELPDTSVGKHPLARLNAMSNKDKHRRLAVVLQQPADVAIGAEPGMTPTFRHGPFSDGDVIATMTVPPQHFMADVRFELGYEIPEMRRGKTVYANSQVLALTPLAQTMVGLLERSVLPHIVGNEFAWALSKDTSAVLE